MLEQDPGRRTCTPRERGAYAGAPLFLRDHSYWKESVLEQFIKDCSPWEGLILEKLMEDCLP